eukprot:358287-Chlamydomonas_euryale.AAC.4
MPYVEESLFGEAYNAWRGRSQERFWKLTAGHFRGQPPGGSPHLRVSASGTSTTMSDSGHNRRHSIACPEKNTLHMSRRGDEATRHIPVRENVM